MVARPRASQGPAVSDAPRPLAVPEQLSLVDDDRHLLACNIEIRVDHAHGRAVVRRGQHVLAHVALRSAGPGSLLAQLKGWKRYTETSERRQVLDALGRMGFGKVEVLP